VSVPAFAYHRGMAAIGILGAGPAGSVAAIALARRGHRVTLFEKSAFPRDKVCGECLSATGIDVLGRLGLTDAFARDLRPRSLTRARAVAVDGSAFETPLPRTMWGVTRRTMDEHLVGVAEQAGVEVRMRTSASLVDTWNGSPRDTLQEEDASVRPVVSSRPMAGREGSEAVSHDAFDVVLLADGGAALGRGEPTGDFGIKAHFVDVDASTDTIELIALSHGGYAGLAPVNDSLWNAAWSVPADLLKRHRGDLDALFREACATSPALSRRFARATQVGPWLSCALPRFAVRRTWPSKVIPLGNAAAALEPVGGEGMGLAMRSAEMAAQAIDDAMRARRPIDVAALRRSFDRLWRIRRTACRGGAVALSHAWLGPLVVGVAQRSPALARVGLSLVGK
jgi:menaquinone-9 beta-reductase